MHVSVICIIFHTCLDSPYLRIQDLASSRDHEDLSYRFYLVFMSKYVLTSVYKHINLYKLA